MEFLATTHTLSQREYDLVLFGATGYTAKICAEYIVKNLPINLRWAIAGRSRYKLEELRQTLKTFDKDRLQPEIETVSLELESLSDVASRTRLIINGIGPYHLYSSNIVEACARQSTHYVGFSLETPWVEEMIIKYHKLAIANSAFIVPTIALAPSDIIGYLVATTIHEQPGSQGTAEVHSTAKLVLSGMSGGSLKTVLSLISTYGTRWISPGNPWALTPTPDKISTRRKSFFTSLFGYEDIPSLGIVTTSFLAIANESIVHRSASLLPEVYGEDFKFHEHQPASSLFAAACVHFATKTALLFLSLSPIRWLLTSILPDQGTGPDMANAEKTESQHFHAVGTPMSSEGRSVKATYDFDGSLYYCSAMMGAEAAKIILEKNETEIEGGIMTPVVLGVEYIERLRERGIKIEVGAL